MNDSTKPNGNGSARFWLRGIAGLAMTAVLTWGTWVTVNVANYVSGEVRGERLTGDQAKILINDEATRLRKERDDKIKEVEARLLEEMRSHRTKEKF